ncbi:deoxyribodipyrimidine photo-lyase type I [Pseudarthrobacter phenanthrenivorans Sphe3]|uniref:Deoxyribodipyrimidine photo-lyase n=1 Tax=Pseudarthrobacter phenanthrenivorans (strain DSM 18606 / JCM 16027 / LMG 23796 / Sphe3) TaxID=930171 RepID=F0M868_PSEPM|nr:deoxyribodipyrimidine photo-lyase [Pseudarthrobacter phenanthrenivorans]ADX73731.1 deoxyribodipyrimidine photo-lyase type I [Pseudarthrobacter phenanthrenivorans Sphe3]
MASSDLTSIVWLRDDLRLDDNPALAAAVDLGLPLTVVYILDEDSEGVRPLGSASRWWLHHSLASLASSLEASGSRLLLQRGPAEPILKDLAAATNAGHLFWNRRYGLPERTVDAAVKAWAGENGIEALSYQANLLFEPWTIRTGAGGPYKVFTPFWRACLASGDVRDPLSAPPQLPPPPAGKTGSGPAGDALETWRLFPSSPDWSGGLAKTWEPGEEGARQRLEDFLEGSAQDYGTGRNIPGVEGTSRLSPHLRFGEVSPFRVWREIRGRFPREVPADVGIFRSELGWREFCWHLLYTNPDLATRNFRPEFDRFEWEKPGKDELAAWQQGRTGYPFVDAGMRQLWQTGWMHNRVRMAAASFLVKNLLADWRTGEAWFWDTLVDADAASNPANWQWVAGSGADASPYYRIFNPVTQSKKFDAAGNYLRQYIPELAGLEAKAIHEPWKAADGLHGYPRPLVDLPGSRERALAAYQKLKDS